MSGTTQLGKIASKRAMKEMIQSDMEHVTDTAAEGYWILFDKENMSKIQLLIKGSEDTPYEGGFYHFSCVLPENYPFKNPSCTYLTTGQGKIRFNPNLYKCGKVCLSILGTWQGPGWSSAMNLRTLCMNLQLVLNQYPVHNEPGYEKAEPKSVTVCSYNKYVRYNVVKHALMDHVTKKTKLPDVFQKVVDNYVAEKGLDYYLDLIERFKGLSSIAGTGEARVYNKSDIDAIDYKWDEMSGDFKILYDKVYNGVDKNNNDEMEDVKAGGKENRKIRTRSKSKQEKTEDLTGNNTTTIETIDLTGE